MNIQPEFVSYESFKIVGVERYTDTGIAAIQQAWDEFTKRGEEIQHLSKPVVCYGFEDYSRDLVMTPGAFPKYYYIASYEVDALDDIPSGMVGREVPAGSFARFTFRGSLKKLPDLFAYIYGDWLPKSGYKMDPAISADFERYPEKITDMENAIVEVHIPVVKAP